jgi:uncharacterized membrane-anchored protein
MIVFGVLLFIAGLYIYTGHNSEILLWRGYNPNRTKKELKQIGTGVIVIGLSPLISGITALFFEDDSIIPLIVMFIIMIIAIIIAVKLYKKIN